MDYLLARDIILEARENRAQIQTTINERNLSVDTSIGACPNFMSNRFFFIIPEDGEHPRQLFKKLLILITSDRVAYNTSQMLFCSLVGCFNDQWQLQLTSLLVSLSVTVHSITIETFKQIYEEFEDIDTDNLNRYEKMAAPHYVFIACLLYNLIGKSLTTRNFAEWMVRRQKTYSNPLGLQETDPLLPILCPKALFCARFYAETRTHWQLRRLHFKTVYILVSDMPIF